MNEQNETRTLQLFYAGLMVDAAANFEHFGVAQQVREKKAREQAVAAPAQLAQLGIGSPKELFERFSGIFGCARWELAELEGGAVQAETRSCLAQALNPARELKVEEALWEGGQRCLFRLS